MNALSIILPVLVLMLIIYSIVKKVNVFSAFTLGAGKVLPLVF